MEGTKVLTRDFMRSLQRSGVEVSGVSTIDGVSRATPEFGLEYAQQTWMANLAERFGYSQTTADLTMLGKLAAKLRWQVAHSNVDIVHAGFASHTIFSAVCALPPSVPFVAQTFGRVENQKWLRRLGTVDRVDGYLTCSAGDVSQLQDLGVPEDRIYRVPPRVEPTHGSKRTGRELLGVDKDAFVTGYIGHVKPSRLPRSFLKQLDRFAAEVNTEAVIVTKDCAGRDFSPFKNVAIIEQSLSPSEKTDVYAGVDVWVFPYDFEDPTRPPVIDPPLTVLEAMGAGRPVIVSDTLTISDYVVHGETGMLVKPGGHQEINNILKQFRKKSMDCSTFGEQAQRHVAEEFNSDVVSDALQDVYQDVISTR